MTRRALWLSGVAGAIAGLLLALAPGAAQAATFSVQLNSDHPRAAVPGCVCQSTAAGGLCTLRAAIQTANSGDCPGMDTIQLSAAGVYTLTEVGADDTALKGDLDITESLLIEGNARVIDASAIGDRVFDIHPSAAAVNMIGLKAMKGHVPNNLLEEGGCMRIQSSTVLLVSVIIGGDPDPLLDEGCSSWAGGGIAATDSILTISSSIVSDNRAVGFPFMPGSGGGILATNTELVIQKSHLIFNNADSGGGGLSISNTVQPDPATLRIEGSFIENNFAVDEGGGASLTAPFQISDSRFAGNELLDTTALGGGGIFVGAVGQAGDTVIVDSQVVDNEAARGAGFSIVGTVRLERVDVVRNRALGSPGKGGGFYLFPNAFVALDQSSVHVNRAENGAGLFVEGSLDVINTTIGLNEATQDGGGVYTESGGNVRMLHTTVRDNTALNGLGGGIFAALSSANNLDRSILFGNHSDDCTGPVTSLGQVVVDSPSCVTLAVGSPADILGTVLGWGPFGYNPPQPPATATVEIAPPNSAIGAAVPCGVGIDQRGLFRLGSECDVGAYEHDAMASPDMGDADADGVEDAEDSCPYAYNPFQEDNGGLNTVEPDGYGDACQCGDQNGEGVVDSRDLLMYRRALAIGDFAAPELCNIYDPSAESAGDCDSVDVAVLARNLAGLDPRLRQACAASAILEGP